MVLRFSCDRRFHKLVERITRSIQSIPPAEVDTVEDAIISEVAVVPDSDRIPIPPPPGKILVILSFNDGKLGVGMFMLGHAIPLPPGNNDEEVL
jgi:hypothetical protein